MAPHSSPLSRILIPTYIALGAAFALLRFVPIDAFCSRALECVVIFREPTAPFRANVDFSFPKVCGDLPRMSNDLSLCVDRPEIFRTDALGFRNDSPVGEPFRALVFGDSFAYGQGSTQTDMPSAVLSELLGYPVYNAAGKTELRYLRSALDAHLPVQEVLYFYLERHARSPEELRDFADGFRPRDLTWFRRAREQWKIFHPLQIMAGKLDRALIHAAILPNRFHDAVKSAITPDSGSHLFYPPTAHFVRNDRVRVDNERAFFTGLSEQLRARGVQLRVILVPEKFTVYFTGSRDLETLHLTALDAELRAAGIPVVHLLPKFMRAIRAPEERTAPLYWRDDTHWSPRGIRVMAEAIVESFRH